MARSRNIKPGFFKNEVLGEMPVEIRLLFIGLWTLADREGRLEDRPRRIKMELFAYDSFDLDPMLNRLQADGFLIRYEVYDVRYIQLINFVKHQDPHYKEKASEIPPAPGTEDLIKATGITRSQRVAILERDKHTCQLCGAKDHLCIDHIIPASRGGSSLDENLQVLCFSCNSTKGNKLDGEERGTKRGKHTDTSIQVRPNVGARLNQKNSASPSDSLLLIPDSLIPDSLGGKVPPPILPECLEYLNSNRPELNAGIVWAKFLNHLTPDKRTAGAWRKFVLSEYAKKPAAAIPDTADPDSKASIIALAQAQGLPKWNEATEQWSVFKARVQGVPA